MTRNSRSRSAEALYIQKMYLELFGAASGRPVHRCCFAQQALESHRNCSRDNAPFV